MSKYLSCIIVGVLLLSATCSSLTLWSNDQIPVLSELAEESEGEMESEGIHLLFGQLHRKEHHLKSNKTISFAPSEKPATANFQEVPNPPPQS